VNRHAGSALALGLAAALLIPLAGLQAAEISLPLYSAQYTASYHFGILRFSAKSRSSIEWDEASAEYRYTTTVEAKGLAALKYPDALSDRSRFKLDCRGLVPIEHRRDDGSDSLDSDVIVTFDMAHARASSRFEGQDFEFELPAGTVDAHTLPLAVILDLMQGVSPRSYTALDRDRLKTYDFRSAGRQTLNTELGEFETLVFEEGSPGSSRSRKVWFAPELDNLLVRMEYSRKGKTAAVMTLDSLQTSNRRGPTVQCPQAPSNSIATAMPEQGN